MFVEFERADLRGKTVNPIWINTNSVFSVQVVREPVSEDESGPNALYTRKTVVEPGIISIRGGDGFVMVLGDLQDTLSKLNDV